MNSTVRSFRFFRVTSPPFTRELSGLLANSLSQSEGAIHLVPSVPGVPNVPNAHYPDFLRRCPMGQSLGVSRGTVRPATIQPTVNRGPRDADPLCDVPHRHSLIVQGLQGLGSVAGLDRVDAP